MHETLGLERLRDAWDKATMPERMAFMSSPYEQSAEGSDEVCVQSIVVGETYEPMVELRWGDQLLQWSPERAKEHAQGMIEAAESALHDAFLIRFMRERIRVPRELAFDILLNMRQWRQRRAELPEDPEGVTK